ncbi:hypothetical protein [Paenibacillus macquariensis]|uniref:Uncharacterized protein n=1 Tax=Paenibacillus macquariensis TaxID=948756 RepID=A0ABY1KF54_9BACL|nr:hypothetical protein [Paenibacillus macquariensis]MEC0092485.1 hypothetical protein [Paenibacillus macquariensis]OAB35444.1 hypothetical protein PMSM_09310 [Paenibacillus macquariensis subsp. macquariensis]SIR74558.1 hypothetical protein SAMN05421578_1617 [Paenibacillus macquariensis]
MIDPKLANIFRWHIERVSFTSASSSVIKLHIPGVNQQDRKNVILGIIDKIRGVTIEEKTLLAVKRCQAICNRKNKELDQAEKMTSNFKKYMEET